jgi:hypothetical protein
LDGLEELGSILKPEAGIGFLTLDSLLHTGDTLHRWLREADWAFVGQEEENGSSLGSQY